MQVGLLGPLEVAGPGGAVRIGGAKERLVLALLLLRAGEVVSRDSLVDALWGDAPPATAVKTLQGYVARVRRALESVGLADLVATRPPGYEARVPSDAIDVTGFERDAASGRAELALGNASRATAALGAALERWRGDALADCRTDGWAASEAVRLDELRLATVEDRIDADLMLGRHGVLVSELESLVVRHPLRERLWAELMLALYRTGRQADAVRAYQRARAVLVDELGLEPGAELRRLDAAVLAGDPALDAPDRPQGGEELAVPLPARIGAASSTVFVGRAEARASLRGAFDAASAGARRVTLISGEPGIGKTSLAAAAARVASDQGAVVLYGRCDEELRIPYQPWVETLCHLVAHAPADVLAAHVEARGSALSRLAPDLVLPAPPVLSPSSDAESERYLLFGAVVDLLARIAVRAPVVIVLDDLHWADRPTIQLLRYLVSGDAPVRLLLVGTFRDSDLPTDHPLIDALAALHRERGVDRLALAGLGDGELMALLESTVRHASEEEGVALRDALLVETDGNPFFVGEMVRHLTEVGAIYEDEQGRWIASSDLRTTGLPVSIREVVGRRIARLGEPTRSALALAAVIGRDFATEVLTRVDGRPEDELIDLCDRAVSASVLTANDDGGYTFAHALIEHTLYDELSAGRRGRTHRLVAEALDDLCGDAPGERIGELAYHWARALPADVDTAIACAQRAGDHAMTQLAPDEAVRWYRNALELLDRAAVDEPRRRAMLLLGLGDAQSQSGDQDHRETLLAAGRLADDVDAVDILVRAALRNNRGWNSVVGGVDRQRVEMLERALSRVGTADSPDRARLLAVLCVELTWASDFETRLSMATEAVDVARRTGDEASLVDAIRLCHESITMPQTLELRRRWNDEACRLADGLGDRTARLQASDWRFMSALEAGDGATMRTARSIFEAESNQIGQPINHWQLGYHRAIEQMLAGNLDRADRAADDALNDGRAAGYADDAFRFYRFQLIGIRWMQGRIAEVIPLIPPGAHDRAGNQIFRAAITFAKSFDDPDDDVGQLLDAAVVDDFPKFADATWLVAHSFWAAAAARAGHEPAAAVLYERLLPWHDQFATTHISVHGSVAHSLGELAHTLGRDDEAEAWFRHALAFHQALDAPFFVASTQASWAGLLVDRDRAGDALEARALAEAALSTARGHGFRFVERDACSRLERLG